LEESAELDRSTGEIGNCSAPQTRIVTEKLAMEGILPLRARGGDASRAGLLTSESVCHG